MDKLQADQEQLQKKVKALEAEMTRRANAAAMAQRQLNQVENELVKLQAEVERKEELEAQVKELSDKRATPCNLVVAGALVEMDQTCTC